MNKTASSTKTTNNKPSKKQARPAREKGWVLLACKKLLPLLIAVAALVILIVVQNGIKQIGTAAEWMTTNVSRYVVIGMGFVTSFLPFSLFEWLVIAAIVAALFFLVRWIVFLAKRKGFYVLRGIATVTVIVLSVVNFYALTAGYAYERAAPPLPYSTVKYTGDETKVIAQYFVDDYISLSNQMERDEDGNVLSPYTYQELCDKLKAEYAKLTDPYFYSHNVNVKRIVNSWFMSDTGITGIAFLPTGEANINTMIPSSSLPHTMAHEMAHTKGVMRENEANLVGYYVLLNSDDPYLRYCGYFSSINDMATAVYISNIGASDYEYAAAARGEVFDAERLAAITVERNNAYRFWAEYKGPIGFMSDFLDDAGTWFNDIYLKFNGQKDGVGSYQNPSEAHETDEIDPDTQKPIVDYKFSKIQQIYFDAYESRLNP